MLRKSFKHQQRDDDIDSVYWHIDLHGFLCDDPLEAIEYLKEASRTLAHMRENAEKGQ